MAIKDVIQQLVANYKTSDPFFIAERRNIFIIREPLGNIFGYYNSSRRTQMIHLNVNLDANMRTFVCAHELGHAILHPRLNTPFLRRNTLFSIDKVEREANTFAVELLISDEVLFSMSNECVTAENVSREHGVPYELIHLKTLV